MDKNPKIIPENFHLFHLKIIESNIASPSNSKDLNYKIDVAHTTMHNIDQKRIKIGLMVSILGVKDDKDTDVKAFFNIDFHYIIDDFERFYDINEKEHLTFNGTFISVLLGISYSTARGIIYERLNDTSLEGVILPIVSPVKMLETRKKV